MERLPEYNPHAPVDENGDVVVPDEPDELGLKYETREDTHGGFDAFRAAAAAAERVLADKQPESTAELGIQKPTLNERLEKIEKRFHFIPQSREELNDMVGLTDKNYIGGAATRLNIILNHQKHLPDKEENLPRRTVERFISRYVGFVENSQHQIRAYHNLQSMVVVEPRQEYLPADSVGILRDWDNDASTRAPILRLARAEALSEHIMTKGETPDPYAVEKGDNAERAIRRRGAEYIAHHRVSDILTGIDHALREQELRLDFWIHVLVEATSHDAAAPSALAALKKLGIISGEAIKK